MFFESLIVEIELDDKNINLMNVFVVWESFILVDLNIFCDSIIVDDEIDIKNKVIILIYVFVEMEKFIIDGLYIFLESLIVVIDVVIVIDLIFE